MVLSEIERLVLPPDWVPWPGESAPSAEVSELLDCWSKFLQRTDRQTAGEMIYDAAVEASPELVSELEPRAIWGSRFADGLSSLLAQSNDADALKQRAEMMGDSGLRRSYSLRLEMVLGY